MGAMSLRPSSMVNSQLPYSGVLQNVISGFLCNPLIWCRFQLICRHWNSFNAFYYPTRGLGKHCIIFFIRRSLLLYELSYEEKHGDGFRHYHFPWSRESGVWKLWRRCCISKVSYQKTPSLNRADMECFWHPEFRLLCRLSSMSSYMWVYLSQVRSNSFFKNWHTFMQKCTLDAVLLCGIHHFGSAKSS